MSPPPSKLTALLPIKAHSARVPNKNFRELNGKPLFRWILDTLLGMDEIEQVVINTDARVRLAECGVVDGGRVLLRDRKPALCGDEVSMNLILEDDVRNCPADLYLMTHATNPLLRTTTIRRALHQFAESAGADSLFSVNRLQMRFYRHDATPVNHDPHNLLPTQELEPWFVENSCLYLFTRESFDNSGMRIGIAPVLFETPPIESIDIDGQEDWQMAVALAIGCQSINGES